MKKTDKYSMKYDFGIRVDLGGRVGSGHFYRCLSIATELKNLGKKVIFLVKSEKDFLAHIGDLNFSYIVLSGKTTNEEINNCKKIINQIKNLIIDLQSKNELYGKIFHGICKIAIIDDVGGIKVYSDLLFNGHIVKKFHDYDLVTKTKTFLGSKYMPIRKEFLMEKDNVIISKGPINNILISFGGSDDLNLTSKLIEKFADKKYNLTIVIGPTVINKNIIKELSEKYSNIHIKNSILNMASLMVKQDLAISSAGITSYELAYLGIPTILIPIDSFQSITANEMMSNGFGINYGFWDDNFQRLQAIINELDEYEKRKIMFDCGRKIIDGKGVLRIIEKLLELDNSDLI